MMPTPNEQLDLTHDTLLNGRVQFLQPARGYRVAADPVLLAAFTPARPGQAVLDIGCGTGAVMLSLAARVEGLALTGLEPDALHADIARQNIALNNQAADIIDGAVGGDWVLPENHYDHVVFNPPYYDAAGYDASPHASRTQAHQLDIPLADWFKAARRTLKAAGGVACILHASQLGAALAALEIGFGAIEIVPVRSKPAADASRVLIRATMGRKTSLILRPDLILHTPDGNPSPASDSILRQAAAYESTL